MKKGYKIGQIVTFTDENGIWKSLVGKKAKIIDIYEKAYSIEILTGLWSGSIRKSNGQYWIEEPGKFHNRNGANKT